MTKSWQNESKEKLKILESRSDTSYTLNVSRNFDTKYLVEEMSYHKSEVGRLIRTSRTSRSTLNKPCLEIGKAAVAHMKLTADWDIERVHDVLVAKQHDYGHGNILEFLDVGVAIRMCDKVARIKNLKGSTNPVNESLLDSFIDLAGYSVILLMLENGTFTLELE